VLVVGVDPGSGVSSPTGLCAIDTNAKDILFVRNVSTKRIRLHHRLRDISTHLEGFLKTLDGAPVAKDCDGPVLFSIESFVMRGKAGETLQRLIGAFLSRVPFEWGVVEVPNTRLKKIIGGHGSADKREVAHGVYVWFSGNSQSQATVERLIRDQEWDQTDALALAIAAFETEGKQ
jgi:Holliday junction resolvasome RuvABC endonuclease subunit